MSLDRRGFLKSVAAVGAAGAVAVAVDPGRAGASSGRRGFPDTIALPNGFQPEGIAIGRLPFAYFGSLATGSIYRASLATGAGRIISTGPGTPSVGLKIDGRGRLFVSGGAAGDARVVDASSGEVLASFKLTTASTFINDVVLTPFGAFFTDSVNQVMYRVFRGAATTIPITGALVYTAGFNANGIARTPDGRALLIVQSSTGRLFRADPRGVTTAVDLGGEALTNGDGLLTVGRTLFVVQNRMNQVAEFRLNEAGTTGRLVTRVGDPRLDVPTTVAAFGDRLYLPNARFGITVTPDTPYSAVAIRRP
jgi:sugar lactone lactonase YvrE